MCIHAFMCACMCMHIKRDYHKFQLNSYDIWPSKWWSTTWRWKVERRKFLYKAIREDIEGLTPILTSMIGIGAMQRDIKTLFVAAIAIFFIAMSMIEHLKFNIFLFFLAQLTSPWPLFSHLNLVLVLGKWLSLIENCS